jgi:transcriptional regulator with XRE-family HTH domain
MENEGARLRSYLLAKTGGKRGWVNDLCGAAGLKRQTLSLWMSGKTSPDLDSLSALARALHVRRYELVAAMDGDLALAETDERTREVLRQEIEAVLDERLGPRREARGRSGAA